MTESMHTSILRRMVRRDMPNEKDTPLTSSRAVRIEMARSADETIGLPLVVLSLAQEIMQLDDMLDGLNDDLMIIGLKRAGVTKGLICVDPQLRAAAIEMQTVGRLLDASALPRKATSTDMVMFAPIVKAFFGGLPHAAIGTELEGWADDIAVGELCINRQAARLMLDDHDYCLIRLTVDLGVPEREGGMIIALPVARQPEPAEKSIVPEIDWNKQFQDVISETHATLDAVLSRFTVPLAQVESLAIGQLLTLNGCTVSSVKITSTDKRKVAHARLGQLGGMRAIRVEAQALPQLGELSASVISADALALIV